MILNDAPRVWLCGSETLFQLRNGEWYPLLSFAAYLAFFTDLSFPFSFRRTMRPLLEQSPLRWDILFILLSLIFLQYFLLLSVLEHHKSYIFTSVISSFLHCNCIGAQDSVPYIIRVSPLFDRSLPSLGHLFLCHRGSFITNLVI